MSVLNQSFYRIAGTLNVIRKYTVKICIIRLPVNHHDRNRKAHQIRTINRIILHHRNHQKPPKSLLLGRLKKPQLLFHILIGVKQKRIVPAFIGCRADAFCKRSKKRVVNIGHNQPYIINQILITQTPCKCIGNKLALLHNLKDSLLGLFFDRTIIIQYSGYRRRRYFSQFRNIINCHFAVLVFYENAFIHQLVRSITPIRRYVNKSFYNKIFFIHFAHYFLNITLQVPH